ncbi:hypothetical protein [Virgibacillus pantothenticus]|uniref:Uncharacterized protein n=1 Tax=Virgibacillus pantothenticus TaxID=1473 RepID=A0A0L0QKN3_VIRPA|nr:hypothetical protein [Virgibacillus pantothenticus]KNE19064.1 hypothetical protein AFK71_10920 [Virgibacillus pantothenticus]QTY15510.1 hypothetical protein KBP50_16700 [Virgibacillus pantothenticus]SIT18324.1 hypothetical protein SAMN05421787_1424 [Virgibacillus pantothenticus]
MTNKERLEEMNRMKRHAIEHDDKPMLRIIEQAEKKTELEQSYRRTISKQNKQITALYKENKRYREAIEYALEELNNSPRLSLEGLEAMEILDDALEGEE